MDMVKGLLVGVYGNASYLEKGVDRGNLASLAESFLYI